MVTYWFTETIPISVTALIPVVLFPVMGIVSSEAICKTYFNGTIMVFLGSLIAATAVEKSNLHERVALKVILLSGTSPKRYGNFLRVILITAFFLCRLLLGFMFTTAFLSMWIR